MEYVELQGLVVVLIGTFNPAIFNPDWLANQGVITPAQFAVGDLTFEVNTSSFALHVLAEPFVRAADIVADLFKDKLAHTPITALGINYVAHFRVENWKQQTALGRALTPLEPWGTWAGEFQGDSIESVGGLVSLTMQMSTPKDREAGNVKVTVQPSNRVVPAGSGVFVQVNDHYETAKGAENTNFPEICLSQITPSLERSRAIVTQLSNLARSF
jgi:hypothetical protein